MLDGLETIRVFTEEIVIDDDPTRSVGLVPIYAELGVDLSAVSLALEGAWRSPGQESWHPLALRSTLSFGALVDLPEVYEGELHDAYAQVRITRRLASLMDGIDLASFTEDEVARALLRNLVTHAQVRVVVGASLGGEG